MKRFRIRTEKDFENFWIKQNPLGFSRCFPIETEETMAGFPDVLCIDKGQHIVLVEMKVLSLQGKIHFRPAQIAFYRCSKDLPIIVAVYTGGDTVKYFASNAILKAATATCSYVLSIKEIERVIANESNDS